MKLLHTMPPKHRPKKASSQVPAAPKQSINWPALRPLVPESELALDAALPGQIITIRNFWSTKLCKDYVTFLSSLPLTTTPGKPKKGDAVRVNDRFQIDDPTFAERLWSETALKNLILGVSENDGLGLDGSQLRELWGGDVVRRRSCVHSCISDRICIGRP
jgi:hypothetical protein